MTRNHHWVGCIADVFGATGCIFLKKFWSLVQYTDKPGSYERGFVFKNFRQIQKHTDW